MREIIEYNLDQLKKLYTSPLLSTHFNLIDGSDDLKIMKECIATEDDGRERFFLEIMCEALFYRAQGRYQDTISVLKNLDVKMLESDPVINDISVIRKGLIALLLAESYYRLKSESSYNWTIRHAKAAVGQFENLKDPSMKENLVYAMMLEDVINASLRM